MPLDHFVVLPIGFPQITEPVDTQPQSDVLGDVYRKRQRVYDVILIEVQLYRQSRTQLSAGIGFQAEACQQVAQFLRIQVQINIEIIRNRLSVFVQHQVTVTVLDVFAPAGEFEVVQDRSQQRHYVYRGARSGVVAFGISRGRLGTAQNPRDGRCVGIQEGFYHIQEQPVQQRVHVKAGYPDLRQDLLTFRGAVRQPESVKIQI